MTKTSFVQINLGKNGINENTFLEIEKNLKVKKDVKVKFLRNFLSGNDRDAAKKSIVSEIKNPSRYSFKMVGNVLIITHKTSKTS